MKVVAGLVAGIALAASAAPAGAQEVFGGVFGHDVDLHALRVLATCCYEHGADLQFGLRSAPLVSSPRWGSVFAYGMGSVNTQGGVDFGAAGLAWRYDFGPGKRFYVQPGLGLAVQDGSTVKRQVDTHHLYLGSRVLFEPEVALGYRVSPRWSVELAYDHLSHAQLAGSQNPGMDDLGLRASYRFGR